MIAIPRRLARSFRAVAKKCLSGRPRGPAPVVVVTVTAGTLCVWTRTEDAVLVYAAPSTGDDATVVVPMAVLAAVEGAGDEPVELAVDGKRQGRARWADRGVPRSMAFDATMPDETHRVPEVPAVLLSMPASFLAALHECGKTTLRDAGRFALNRLQVKGASGTLAATDSKVAVLWGGFSFPFAADVLVPAIPVFGSRELRDVELVALGCTKSHLVVSVGPWRVHLPIDAAGRFPDVESIRPRTTPTVAGFDDRDAAALVEQLPALPGVDGECQPVTLDLNGSVTIHARGVGDEDAVTLLLDRSPTSGPAARVAVDRRPLARALSLGCVTVRVAPDRPVVFEGGPITMLLVALDPSLAVGPPAEKPPSRRTAMSSHERNGSPPQNGHAESQPDPLVEAEALRTALIDATQRAGKLVALLKGSRKEKKALATVWAGLKQLNLAPGGQP